MKKSIALLAGAAILAACQPAQKTGKIEGLLTGVDNDTLLIFPRALAENARNERDTLILQDGKFTYQVENDTLPYEIFISPVRMPEQYIHLVLLPGESLRVTGSLTDYQVEGSEFIRELQAVQESVKPYNAKMDSLSAVMTQLQKEQGEQAQADIRKLYEEQYRPTMEQMQEAYATYVKQHPDHDVSLYLLRATNMDKIRELLPTLSEGVKNGPLASLYAQMNKGVQQAQAREEAAKKIVEGAPAPDFTLNDLQGKGLSLSSLRGKYVVLDFWGSWCGWCIKGIPDMKKYYEKYKAKMEILGIDCRDTEEKWKAAVEKYELPWLHVRNEGDPDVSILYAIQGYPTKIVVDPEGKIAKIVIGEDPAFYEYLDTLFK